NAHDLAFVLLYLLDDAGRRAELAGSSGLNPGAPGSPAAIDLDDPAAPWPLAEVVETGGPVDLIDVPREVGPLPGGAWPEPAQRAVVLPMKRSGQAQLAGFVVAGVGPRLQY